MFKLYGIKNCNTVKKSVDWLHSKKIDFEFMDVKKVTLDVVLFKAMGK